MTKSKDYKPHQVLAAKILGREDRKKLPMFQYKILDLPIQRIDPAKGYQK